MTLAQLDCHYQRILRSHSLFGSFGRLNPESVLTSTLAGAAQSRCCRERADVISVQYNRHMFRVSPGTHSVFHSAVHFKSDRNRTKAKGSLDRLFLFIRHFSVQLYSCQLHLQEEDGLHIRARAERVTGGKYRAALNVVHLKQMERRAAIKYSRGLSSCLASKTRQHLVEMCKRSYNKQLMKHTDEI